MYGYRYILRGYFTFCVEYQIYLIECVDFVHFPIEEAGGENAKQKKNIENTNIFGTLFLTF